MKRIQDWLAPLRKRTITPLAIDLGTSFTRVSFHGQLVMQIPTVVSRSNNIPLSAGISAAQIKGKNPHFIEVETPIYHSAVNSFDGVVLFLQQVLEDLYRHHVIPQMSVISADVAICDDLTTVQRDTLRNCFLEAGFQSVRLRDKKYACLALLERITQESHPSGLVIDSGAGGTDCVVIHQGEIVLTQHMQWGGTLLEQQIRESLRSIEFLEIGWQTVETLKIELACLPFWMLEDAVELGVMQNEWMNQKQVVTGKNISTFLPERKTIEARTLHRICQQSMEELVQELQQLSEQIDIDILRIVLENDIVILGQNSLLRGFSQTISTVFQHDVHQVEGTGESILRGLISEQD